MWPVDPCRFQWPWKAGCDCEESIFRRILITLVTIGQPRNCICTNASRGYQRQLSYLYIFWLRYPSCRETYNSCVETEPCKEPDRKQENRWTSHTCSATNQDIFTVYTPKLTHPLKSPNYYRAKLCVSAVFAVARCPSVRPSVSLSVTFVHRRL